MLVHRMKQVLKMLRYHREIRALVVTHLVLLETGDHALGGITSEEEEKLIELLQLAGDGIVVEVGTLFGLTTKLLMTHKRNEQKIITVDNFTWNPFGLTKEMHRSFTQRILRNSCESSGAELVEKDSQAFRADYQGPTPVMVFFDADHSYMAVQDEIRWAKQSGIKVICGHDYGVRSFGVTRAVDEAFPNGVQVRGSLWFWRAEGV